MNVLLFGATGMVGQGVLRECLLDPDVQSVVSIARGKTGKLHQKLREILHNDFVDFSPIEPQLSGFDACFFCLGVSSLGMTEDQYRRLTYDLTMTAAKTLARLNPAMTFIYVSGMGTDTSEKGRLMWARVKGKTENDLLRLPFKSACMFRPAAILPRSGIRSKTKLYQTIYTVMAPLLPLLHSMFPKYVTTTDQVGRAMLKVAKFGAPKSILENSDINRI